MINSAGGPIRYNLDWRPPWADDEDDEVPEWILCVTLHLGLSVALDKEAYLLCVAGLKYCGYTKAPPLIIICLAGSCAGAAAEIIEAIQSCT